MKALLVLLTFLASVCVYGQTTLSEPYVLGCTNPAPAVPLAPTVWLSNGCKTPAFMPTSTTSIVGSGNKAAPIWAHTLRGYPAQTLVIACPKNATLSTDASQCTNQGADASVLATVSNIPSLAITPPPVAQTVTVTARDYPAASATFPGLPTPECFTLSNGVQSVTACLP